MRATAKILFSAALLGVLPVVAHAQPATVILVRHAEKASSTEGDPSLSDAGFQRAKDLARALADAQIGSIITTQWLRTRQTAADVVAATKLTPIVMNTVGGPAHPAEVAAAIMKRPAGEVVLVVGHSNTITKIVGALGGPKIADICDSQYSNLYVMEMNGPSGPKLIRASYGKADPVDAACAAMK